MGFEGLDKNILLAVLEWELGWSVEGEEAGSGGLQALGSCNLYNIFKKVIIFSFEVL